VRYDVSIDGKLHRVELTRTADAWLCRVDGRELSINAEQINSQTLSLLVDVDSYEVRRPAEDSIFIGERRYQVFVDDPRSWRGRKRTHAGNEGPQKLTASMPGKIVRVLAAEGEQIIAGQGIAVVEAMKMQNEMKSPKDGVVSKIHAIEGATVAAGEALLIVE
jgi:biotin carboxyl carrier protein